MSRQAGNVLKLDGIAHAYGPTPALRGVSLTVQAGEVVAVTGPSGCGKSTLLHVAAGIVRADLGDVSLLGEDLMVLGETHRTDPNVTDLLEIARIARTGGP